MNPLHFSSSGLLSKLGLTKSNIVDVAKLGGGAALGITSADLLQSRVLVKNGVPMIPPNYGPWFNIAYGIVTGGLAAKFLGSRIGLGWAAGAAGVGISALIASFISPPVAASAAAATAAESTGDQANAVQGFGFGRAFAPSLAGLAGLGRVRRSGGTSPLLFGVGTPDMSAARMFSGATVAIEPTGPMAGATVAIEPAGGLAGGPNFAAAFS